MKIIPTKKQWLNWSMPSKLTAIGTLFGFISVLIGIANYINIDSVKGVFEDNREIVVTSDTISGHFTSLIELDEIHVQQVDTVPGFTTNSNSHAEIVRVTINGNLIHEFEREQWFEVWGKCYDEDLKYERLVLTSTNGGSSGSGYIFVYFYNKAKNRYEVFESNDHWRLYETNEEAQVENGKIIKVIDDKYVCPAKTMGETAYSTRDVFGYLSPDNTPFLDIEELEVVDGIIPIQAKQFSKGDFNGVIQQASLAIETKTLLNTNGVHFETHTFDMDVRENAWWVAGGILTATSGSKMKAIYKIPNGFSSKVSIYNPVIDVPKNYTYHPFIKKYFEDPLENIDEYILLNATTNVDGWPICKVFLLNYKRNFAIQIPDLFIEETCH